jgi:hypothetical protein
MKGKCILFCNFSLKSTIGTHLYPVKQDKGHFTELLQKADNNHTNYIKKYTIVNRHLLKIFLPD